MLEYRTSVDFCLDALSGKWKVLILSQLSDKNKRLSDILSEIPGLTKRVLIRELRELEEDMIIERHEYSIKPPHVEYSITEHGKKLEPIIEAMNDWGLQHIELLNKNETQILTANSFTDLKEKIAAGGKDIEQLKEQSKSDLSHLEKELFKRGKRITGKLKE